MTRDPHLQHEGGDDEAQHDVVEFMSLADGQHVLELRGVGGEQSHVQHALRHRLLGRIMVSVQTLAHLPDKRRSERWWYLGTDRDV